MLLSKSYLMNDTASWPPETNAILGAGTGQEVINLLVGLHSVLEVGLSTKLVLPEGHCCLRNMPMYC